MHDLVHRVLRERRMSMPPVTWTFTVKQVETVWRDTRQVFGNKLWTESMLYDVFLPEWQQELEQRAGREFLDILNEAVGGLGGDDPSLVCLGFQRTFGTYGVVTEFARHPLHGDVLKRARRIESDGTEPDAPVRWTLPQDALFDLCAEIEDAERDEELVAEAFAIALSEQQLDELERRYGGELSELVYAVLADLTAGDGPEVVIHGVQQALADLGITLGFRGVKNVLPARSRTDTPPPPPRG
jgi:hypothetical protein